MRRRPGDHITTRPPWNQALVHGALLGSATWSCPPFSQLHTGEALGVWTGLGRSQVWRAWQSHVCICVYIYREREEQIYGEKTLHKSVPLSVAVQLPQPAATKPSHPS